MSQLRGRLRRLEEAADRVGGPVQIIIAGPDGSGCVNGQRMSAEELEHLVTTRPGQYQVIQFVRPKEWEDAYPESPAQPVGKTGK